MFVIKDNENTRTLGENHTQYPQKIHIWVGELGDKTAITFINNINKIVTETCGIT